MKILRPVYSLLSTFFLVSLGPYKTLAGSKTAQIAIKQKPTFPTNVIPPNTPLPKKAFEPVEKQYYLDFDTTLDDFNYPNEDSHDKTIGSYYNQGIWEPLFPGSLRAKRSTDLPSFSRYDANIQKYDTPFLWTNSFRDLINKVSESKNEKSKYPLYILSNNRGIYPYSLPNEDEVSRYEYNPFPNIKIKVLRKPNQPSKSTLQENQYLPPPMSTDKLHYQYNVLASQFRPENFFYPKTPKFGTVNIVPTSSNFIIKNHKNPPLFRDNYVSEKRQPIYSSPLIQTDKTFYPETPKFSTVKILPLSSNFILKSLKNPPLFGDNYRNEKRGSINPTQNNLNNKYLANVLLSQQTPKTKPRSKSEVSVLSKGIQLFENFLTDGNKLLDYLKELNAEKEQQSRSNFLNDNHQVLLNSLNRNSNLLKKNYDTHTPSRSNDVNKLKQMNASITNYSSQTVQKSVQDLAQYIQNFYYSQFNSNSNWNLGDAYGLRYTRGVRDGSHSQPKKGAGIIRNPYVPDRPFYAGRLHN